MPLGIAHLVGQDAPGSARLAAPARRTEERSAVNTDIAADHDGRPARGGERPVDRVPSPAIQPVAAGGREGR
jgi:hypothetical protein